MFSVSELTASVRKHLVSGAKALVAVSALVGAQLSWAAQPLTVGYSDWPGWVAWQVAIDKGWFKQAGVDVKFEWFDYSASLEAFAAGKIDAVPGHLTKIRIRADVPGRYGGVCAEYCGTGHTGMRFAVEAHPPEVYRQRLTALSAGVPAP